MSSYENYITLLNINEGVPGQPGAPGKDAQKYRVDSNQEEILKFFANSKDQLNNLDLEFSPDEFIVSFYEIAPEEATGERKISLTSIENLQLFDYDQILGWSVITLPEKYEYIEEETGISKEYIYYSLKNDDLIMYFNNFKIYSSNDKLPGETDEQFEARINAPFFSFSKKIINEDSLLKIRYKIIENDKTYIAEKIISIRNAMTNDMAKLSVEANKIFSSIASTSLEFSANGLQVRNGGLKIINNDSVEVFRAKPDGNLVITGEIYATSGYFSGEIQATSGTFNGSINSNNGRIGGFEIGEHSIKSNQLELWSSYEENGAPIESKIIAKNIEIGTGAKIQEYIQLGDSVRICNPQNSPEGNFIEIFNENSQNIISLKENGTIILGNPNESYIQLDGAGQQIFGFAQDSSDYNWIINPKEAVFNNIVARGSIKAATFEYGAIQAMGGSLLIRPSSRIVEINDFEITLENSQSGFYKDDLCVIETNEGGLQYYYIDSINNNIIILRKDSGEIVKIDESYIGSPIINLGVAGSIGIGINGSSSNSYGIAPNTISIVEHNGLGVLDSKIILGKLPDSSEAFGPAANSYGLYAENVVLNGSITTKTLSQSDIATYNNSEFSYSGIGTTLGQHGAPTAEFMDDKFPEVSRGQILFWAGAKGTLKDDVEASKFFVDQYGNMYAGSGYFEGAIISKSTIEAAEIKTAVLTGTGNKNNSEKPALMILDVAEGIHFYDKSKVNPVFRLSNSDFIVDGLTITLNNNLVINKEGTLGLSRLELKDGLFIEETTLSHSKVNSEIKFADNSDIILQPSSGKEMVISQQGVSMNGHIFYMNGKNIEGEYRQVKNEENQIIGYDLYIY